MARPAITVEMAFGSTWKTASPSWTNVTAYLIGGVEWQTGRGRDSTNLTAGTAKLTLRNRDDRFTPLNSSGAFYPNVKPLVPVRIRATWNSITYDVWRGVVRNWQPNWDNPSDARCDVDCVDVFYVFNDREITSQYADEVLALSPSYYYRCGKNPKANGFQFIDETGNGYHGYGDVAPGSGQSLIAGDQEGSAAFPGDDAVSQKIWAPSNSSAEISGTEAFSVALWWHPQGQNMSGAGGNERKLWMQATGGTNFCYVSYDLATSGRIKWALYNGVTTQAIYSAATYSSTDGPLFIVVTRSGSTHLLYVNGVQVGTLTGTALSLTATNHYWGADTFSANQCCKGAIDELAFWKATALTGPQIATLYGAGTGWLNDSPAQRVVRVLDKAGWPGTGTSSGTGRLIDQRPIPASTGAEPGPRMREWPAPASVLSLLQDAVDAEDGDCFIDGQGRVRFIDAHGRPTSISDQVKAAFPAAYWPLGETGGTTAFDAHTWPQAGVDALFGYVTKNGTYTGSPLLNQGSLIDHDSGQRSVDFNGTNQYVTVSNAAQLQFTTSFTLAGVCRPDTFTTENPIVAKSDAAGRDWWLVVDTAGHARCGLRTSGAATYEVTSSVTMTAGNTYAVLGWYDDVNNTIGVCVNGTATTAAVAGSVSAGTSTRPVEIGRRHDGTAFRYMDGRMSHIWVSTYLVGGGGARGGFGWETLTHVQTTFDDDSPTLPYVRARPVYEPEKIKNKVVGAYPDVTGIGANQPDVSDAASDTDYGTRRVEVSPNLTELGAFYGWLWVPAWRQLSRLSQPRMRIVELELDGHLAATTLWPILLGLELSDRVAALRHTYSGHTMTSTGYIDRIEHAIDDGDRWQTRIQLTV